MAEILDLESKGGEVPGSVRGLVSTREIYIVANSTVIRSSWEIYWFTQPHLFFHFHFFSAWTNEAVELNFT